MRTWILRVLVVGILCWIAVLSLSRLFLSPLVKTTESHVKTTEDNIARAEALLRQWENPDGRDAIDYEKLINVRLQLEIVPATDPLRSEAARLNAALMPARDYLADRSIGETKRKAQQREEARRIAVVKTAAERERFARILEQDYLKRGMDVRARAEGNNNTTLNIEYVLMGRPLVYGLTNKPDFIDVLYRAGFSKLVLSDGYRQSWSCAVDDSKICTVPGL